jgi:polyisoprenoid-binding protein YceI
MFKTKINGRALRIRVPAIACFSLVSFLAAQARLQLQNSSASEIALAVDPARSEVRWSLESTLHTVHGKFALNGGEVQLDSATGRVSGEIVVSATSGESGNKSRDARMHKEILETAKYPEVIFRPTQLDGKVVESGASDCKIHGIFSIHGGDHEIVAPVHIEFNGVHWKETTNFEVPYVSWGIKDPSNFLLRVNPTVIVELTLSGEVKSRQ